MVISKTPLRMSFVGGGTDLSSRGSMNFHYENMAQRLDSLRIQPSPLHYDDGVSELDPEPIFDWSAIYGRSPP